MEFATGGIVKVIGFDGDTIKLKKFTKEDLKYGNVIELENGGKYIYTFFKDFPIYNEEKNYFLRLDFVHSNARDFIWEKDIKDNLICESDKKIIKVYRDFTLKEVIWRRPKDILDKVEKEYLSAVIKPFRHRVKYIVKKGEEKQFLEIMLDNNEDDFTWLPYFKENTMYKGMELDKQYTLEELGL